MLLTQSGTVTAARCCRLASRTPRRPHSRICASSSVLRDDSGAVIDAASIQCCIVLGGGLRSDGSLPPWVSARCSTTAQLVDTHLPKHCVVLCSGAWTPHKPAVVLPHNGHALHEATVMAQELVHKYGLSPHRVLKECNSADTVGNAYFTLTTHVLPAGWTRVLVVTSAFHSARTAAAFRWVYRMANIEPVFVSSPDDGLRAEVLAARLDKEKQAIAALTSNAERITDLRSFHAWLFDTHACYAVPRQGELLSPEGVADKAAGPASDSY